MASWDPNFHNDDSESYTRVASNTPSPRKRKRQGTSGGSTLIPRATWRPDPTSATPANDAVFANELSAIRPAIARREHTAFGLPEPIIAAEFLNKLNHYYCIIPFNTSTMTTVAEFEGGHGDRITALHVNFDGSKILTASIDHRIKVWERDRETGKRSLVDTFTAHDGDIRDAKWLHPSAGTYLATIGNDLMFRLWSEDASQATNSGRRFKPISQIQSTNRVPFVSLDLKHVDPFSTYLALIDRQGLLSVYEPGDPDEFKEWKLLDQWNVCSPVPGRGDETSFRVRFDPNLTSLPYNQNLTDDTDEFALVATALNEVKIYRSVSREDSSYGNSHGHSHGSGRLTLHLAAQLPTHPALIRDVQWNPFNSRGVDVLATACRDGSVRIYEVKVTPTKSNSNSTTTLSKSSSAQAQSVSSTSKPLTQHSSTLTTAIVGRSAGNNNNNITTTITPLPGVPSPPAPSAQTPPRHASTHTFPYATHISLVAEFTSAHKDAWTLSWDPTGRVLMSNGGDGVAKLWRRSALGTGLGIGAWDEQGKLEGEWKLFADQEIIEVEETDSTGGPGAAAAGGGGGDGAADEEAAETGARS